MSVPTVASRYEPQVGLAAAAPPVLVDLRGDAEREAPLSSALHEAESLLPHDPSPRSELRTANVDRLRRGFYAYSIASEVFVIVAGTLFLPVVLETYARENGRLAPDFVDACPPSGRGGGGGEVDPARCAVRFFGLWIDTASVALLTYSASVAAQALTVISIGKLADDPYLRHRFLSGFALIGSLACISFLVIPSSSVLWPISTLLALVANVSFGASIVCLNSFLPELGRLDPAVAHARGSLRRARHSDLPDRVQAFSQTSGLAQPNGDVALSVHDDDDDDDASVLSASPAEDRVTDAYTAARERATARLSGRAIAAGYAAGIAVLLALLPVVAVLSGGPADDPSRPGERGEGNGTWPLRVAVAVSGAWWLLGTIPAIIWLRPVSPTTATTRSPPPRPRLTSQSGPEHRSAVRFFFESVQGGWTGLAEMLREWRRLPQAFLFLAAWFLLSDAFATITSTAILFAKTSLGLSTSGLVVIAILTPLSGLLGALLCPLLQQQPPPSHPAAASAPPPLHLTTHRILLGIVLLSLLVPLAGLLLALRTPTQMYALATLFAFLFGAFQALARALYAQLIPPTRASRFFALYSITDKSSSFLGPLLVAVVTTVTGEIRHGFVLIAGLMVVAVPVLARVDVARGAEDAERMNRELKRTSQDDQA